MQKRKIVAVPKLKPTTRKLAIWSTGAIVGALILIAIGANNINATAGVSGIKKTQYTSDFSCTNWTVPTGVSQATIEAWGAGGAGGTALVNGGGGGGGGAYARGDFSIAGSYNVSCGTGGAGAGPSSTFNSTTVVAAGGAAGGNGSATNGQGVGGAGGTTAASTGTVEFAGGAGGGGTGGTPGTTQINGGGGGTGAGNSGAGLNGSSNRRGGFPGQAGGGEGASGAGAASGGSAARLAGGGGGGASTTQAKSNGANGQVVISPFAESNTVGAASGSTVSNNRDSNLIYNADRLGYESLSIRTDTAADPGAILPIELRLMSTASTGTDFTSTVRYRIYKCNSSCGTFANWSQVGSDQSKNVTITATTTDSGFVDAGNTVVLDKSGDITYYSVLAWSGDRDTVPTTCTTDPTQVSCMRVNVSVLQSNVISVSGPTITGCNPCDPSTIAKADVRVWFPDTKLTEATNKKIYTNRVIAITRSVLIAS